MSSARELKVVHFVDELLSRANVSRSDKRVDHVALAEALLQGATGPGGSGTRQGQRGGPALIRSSSPQKKQERSVVVADIADSIRHSFGSKSSAEGEAAVKEFLLNLESLDNQPVPELDSFLEILREIHDNPQVAQVVGAGYDFTPASELRARLSPSRSPVRSTYPSSPSSRFTVNRDRDLPSSAAAASARRDRLAPQVSDTDLRTSLESLSQRLDASVANMGREGGSVLGNSTAGNQRPGSSASGTGYKRSLNFVTGQRPAGAPATGSRESSAGSASRTRADRVEGTEGVSSLLSSFASTSRREPSAALARAAQSAEVLRRAASDVSSIGLAAGADHNEGPSEVFGNISSIHGGPSEQPSYIDPTPESRRTTTTSYARDSARPSYSASRTDDLIQRSAVDSGYRTMSQIHSRTSENVPPETLGSVSHEPSHLTARPYMTGSPRRQPRSNADTLVAPSKYDTPPSPSANRYKVTLEPSSASLPETTPSAFAPSQHLGPSPGAHEEFSPSSSVAATEFALPKPKSSFDPSKGGRRPPLGTLPLEEQEKLIVDDLLYVLLWINGIYIRPHKQGNASFDENPETMEARRLGSRHDGAWEIDSTMDPSLAKLVEMILPVARHYHKLIVFMTKAGTMDAGRISNSVAAAVRGLIKEYTLLVVQLETVQRQGQLSLQKLFYHINPAVGTMRALLEIATMLIHPPKQVQTSQANLLEAPPEAPTKNNGCAMVGMLEKKLMERAGDPVHRALYMTLLRASLPGVLNQIREWIYKGSLKDDGKDFFIERTGRKSDTDMMNSESWGDEIWNNFNINPENVPPIFEEVQVKILDAGVNWDVIRACKKKVGVSKASIDDAVSSEPSIAGNQQLVQTLGISGIFNEIELAFTSSNRALLDLLMRESDLMSRLRSMKRYFFLDSADFLVSFLDLASDELSKKVDEVSRDKLQNLWDLSTGGRSDNFRIEVSRRSFLASVLALLNKKATVADKEAMPFSFSSMMTAKGFKAPVVVIAFEGFELSYLTSFPASIMFNWQTVIMYKTLFRHLFNCKHMERQLSQSWQEQTGRKWLKPKGVSSAPGTPNVTSKSSPAADLARFENRMGVLRQQMLLVLRQVMLYMSIDVIDTRFKILETQIAAATTVRQVMNFHEDFLKECCAECMITEAPVIEAFTRVIYTIQTFCSFSSWVAAQMRMIESGPASILLSFSGTYSLPDTLLAGSPPTTPPETLAALETIFKDAVNGLIESIQGAKPKLQLLAQRLDFDGWYTASKSASAAEAGAASLDTPDMDDDMDTYLATERT